MNKIGTSFIRENKMLSAALFVLYTIIISLLVMVVFVAPSFDATVSKYLAEYGAYDVNITTVGTPVAAVDEIAELGPVENVSGRLVLSGVMKTDIGNVKTIGLASVSDSDRWKIMDTETGETVHVGDDSVLVSSVFAEKNNIHSGSTLWLKTDQGFRKVKVTNVVSCPETMATGLTFASWYDLTSYGVVYASESIVDRYNTEGLVNDFRIILKDDADIDEAITLITKVIGKENITHTIRYQDSMIAAQIAASIDGVRSITTYLPAFVIIIGLLFSTVFISQIVIKSRKCIGLLRALGYRKEQVCSIFISYILAISVTASVAGAALGRVLLAFIMNIYRDFYYLPYIVYDGNLVRMIILIVSVNIVAVLSVLLVSRSIAEIEPSAAYGGEMEEGTELPIMLSRIRCNSFTKLTISMIYRNRRRVLVTMCCTFACIILCMQAFSVLISKNTALDYTFNERYPFDFAVYNSNEEELMKIADHEYVKDIDYRYQYDMKYENEALRLESSVKLGDEPGIELEEGFARRHGLKKGDHIEIKGHDLEVTGICRQYLCSTQYVSKKQARELGYVPNVVTGSISDADRLKEFESDCAELDGFMEILLMDETRRSVEEAMAQIDIPCNIFIACSFILGYVIMLNMSLISFSRRKRDIATLRALGTENRRFFRILAGEALVEFLPACLIAPLAFPLIEKILLQMSSVSEEYVLVHRGGMLLLSCLVALLCTIAGVAGTFAKVKKMDFASELNNRD